MARGLLRVATVLCLLLAAIVLGADHAEYSQLSRAGLHAMARGVLPLLAIGVLSLRAIDGDRVQRLAAVAGALLILWTGARMLAGGGPPLAYMLVAVALLLLGGLLPLLAWEWRGGPPPRGHGS